MEHWRACVSGRGLFCLVSHPGPLVALGQRSVVALGTRPPCIPLSDSRTDLDDYGRQLSSTKRWGRRRTAISVVGADRLLRSRGGCSSDPVGFHAPPHLVDKLALVVMGIGGHRRLDCER